jgi:hypothetical protein
MKEGKTMPAAGSQSRKAKYGAVIYLRGIEQKQLDDAERRCREYAGRFGWPVLESIRDTSASATPGQLIAKVTQQGAQIILLTDTPDMIAPDHHTRHDLIMAIEGAGCIVHPISTPCRP